MSLGPILVSGGGAGDITIVTIDNIVCVNGTQIRLTQIEFSTDGSTALTPLGGMSSLSNAGNQLMDGSTSGDPVVNGNAGPEHTVFVYEGDVTPTHIRQSIGDNTDQQISTCDIRLWRSTNPTTTTNDTTASVSAASVSSTGAWTAISFS